MRNITAYNMVTDAKNPLRREMGATRKGRKLGIDACGAIHGALGMRWGGWVSLAAKSANTTRWGRGTAPVFGGMHCYEDVLYTVEELKRECDDKADCKFTIVIEQAAGTLKARYAPKVDKRSR